jgi:hypothetical protein
MLYMFILAVLIAIALGAVAVTMAMRASDLARRLQSTRDELGTSKRLLPPLEADVQALRRKLEEALTSNEDLHAMLDQTLAAKQEINTLLEKSLASSNDLQNRLDQATQGVEQKDTWLDHQQQEMAWLRAELEKRPKITRKTYKILTLGVKWTGKTSLTLKWANPLTDLGAIQGTKIERYQRTVSQAVLKDVTTEHVFEIGDWGGEHIIDALQELIIDEIHGMLLVVDLGGKDARAVEPARIQEQLQEFQSESLRFFFCPKTVASCKTVVLFINKSDLLPGTPAEVEAQAKQLYGRLIESLLKYQAQVDIRVFVGSANYGHSTHLLFSHFVEKILPRNAYDGQLLQRMKKPPNSSGGA